MAKTALITGITGQDGSFLAELLLEKGYAVHGVIRRSSSFNTQRIDHIYRDPHLPDTSLLLHYGDLSDSNSLRSLVNLVDPDEVYNLGAQSHVRVSFDLPEYTADVVGLGALRLLDAVREAEQQRGKQIRFYQASSSEIYGLVQEVPQLETTPFYPRSPYACAKVFAFHQTVNYREGYGMHASNGILFNHESERRGETFVTRKITRAATRIGYGLQKKLYLGNLEASRDWGYARDYVEGMWRIVQQDVADDFVLATNETHSVREFVVAVFGALGAHIEWRGEGTDEVGVVESFSPTAIELADKYFRPTEVDLLLGDASKAKNEIGWTPSTSFGELVRIMTEHDCLLAKKDHHLQGLD
jgi:GDPmannose 4,6-dehydratase